MLPLQDNPSPCALFWGLDVPETPSVSPDTLSDAPEFLLGLPFPRYQGATGPDFLGAPDLTPALPVSEQMICKRNVVCVNRKMCLAASTRKLEEQWHKSSLGVYLVTQVWRKAVSRDAASRYAFAHHPS